MKNELIPVETSLAVNPWNMLDTLIKSGRDVQQLKDMMDLIREWEAGEASKKWSEAIRLFQSKCPRVVKENPVYGKDRTIGPQYHFAGYDDVMKVAQPLLSECGITVTFDFRYEGSLMHTTCHVRVGTHVEDTTVPVALPQIPNANESQKAGGALKYGMRYALVAALNIQVTGEDDDAQGQGVTIGSELLRALEGQINKCKHNGTPVNMPKFLAWLGIEKLEDLPKESFAKAIAELERKANQVPV